MSQTFEATVPRSDLQSATLGQLLHLPLENRYVSILQAGRNDLTATLWSLRYIGAPLPLGLDAERLAWAVAFNVEGPSTSGGGQLRRAPGRPGILVSLAFGHPMEDELVNASRAN